MPITCPKCGIVRDWNTQDKPDQCHRWGVIVRFKLCCNCARFDTDFSYDVHACQCCKVREAQQGVSSLSAKQGAPTPPGQKGKSAVGDSGRHSAQIIAEALAKARQFEEEVRESARALARERSNVLLSCALGYGAG